jgi:hypothetical protein
MRIVQKTDNNITPNKWILSLIKSLSLHLDGQTITLRIQDKPEYTTWLDLLKKAVNQNLNQLNPNQLKGMKIKEVKEPKNPKDLVVEIDYSSYQEPNPLNLTGLRSLLHIWVKEIYFNDWKTTSNIQIRWKKHGLGIRIPFESSGHEITIKKSWGPLKVGAKVNIDDFYFDLHLVPYIFWFPDLAAAKDKTGKEIAKYNPSYPKEVWASGRGIYKHCCTVFIDYGWSNFSPNIMDAENKVKKAAEEAFAELPKLIQSYVRTLFLLFATFILKEPPSNMRGIHIQPNNAQFMYLDDEVEKFKGKGRIVAVRKNAISNHRQNNKGKNIIEVEVEDEKGKRVRINSLNLIESILDKDAEIDNAHPVIRNFGGYSSKPIWGKVQLPQSGVPWKNIIPWNVDMCRPAGMAIELKYNGYLRSNPDNQPQNNLDNLPTYSYDRSKPLYKNIYDGSFLFTYPHWPTPSAFQRDLRPRKWKFPSYHDREHLLLNDFD